MAQVTGIGGFFFRAKDTAGLARWYKDHLGIDAGDAGLWMQAAGPTVFAPFKEDSDYFAADRRWMLNLRVDDRDGMVERLRSAGIEVITKPEWDADYGLFARLHDPEGNPIELWQPLGG